MFLFFNHGASAQIQGHPAENGPKVIINDQELLCNQMANNSSTKEKDFCNLWDKKYETEKDFIELIGKIKLTIFYDTLENLSKKSGQPLCMRLNDSKDGGLINKRSSSKKEAGLLKDILLIWKESAESEDCKSKFSNRILQIDELEFLIKIYEASNN